MKHVTKSLLPYWDVSNAAVGDVYMRIYRMTSFEESMMEEGYFALLSVAKEQRTLAAKFRAYYVRRAIRII